MTENLDHAIVAKAHTSMYLMHKYWARKPHNVVSDYIKFYTKENDIVLDPFCGSGVTPMEAIKLGRRAIGLDLNPLSEFIIKNTLTTVRPKEIEAEFNRISDDLKDKINATYKTKCLKCGFANALILASIWQRGEDAPKELRYYCEVCKKRHAKKPSNADLELLDKVAKLRKSWYPKDEFNYKSGKFLKREGKTNIQELFTDRNLYALSILFDDISKIENKKMQELFKFAFTSMVHLASKMCPVAKAGGKGHWSKLSTTSFWALQSYWTPPTFMESNVWMLFESSIMGNQGVIRGIGDAQEQVKTVKFAKNFEELNNGDNILIENTDAVKLSKIIPQDSVDYIFTDPPYGGAVQYFELSTLWASWLKFHLDYEDEVTINSQQNKDFEYYHKMMKSAFREMYIVLKANKVLTVTFHSTDIKVWNSIIKAVVLSGFDLEKIVYQPPARTSAKGLLQPYGSAVGDYYIRFRKPKKEVEVSEKEMDAEAYEREVILAAKEIIEERGEPTIYQHILNGIMVKIKGGRYAPVGARGIEEVLKNQVGNEFDLIPIKNEKGKTVGKRWWLKGRDFTNFSRPALRDRVERVVLNVLDKKVKVTFDDVLQDIFLNFPNALTPDTDDIQDILAEYAEKTKGGMWRLKPSMQLQQRETDHSRMIYYLALLGAKAGFDIFVGQREQRDTFDGKSLKELGTDIKKFKNVPDDASVTDRIRMIDVLWLENGLIKYEFEVENTTGISDAVIRGSNIPDELNVKRFIIIPKERERKLHKRLQEPIIYQAVKKDNWQFITYEHLEALYNNTKKQLNLKELDNIAKTPEERLVRGQVSL